MTFKSHHMTILKNWNFVKSQILQILNLEQKLQILNLEIKGTLQTPPSFTILRSCFFLRYPFTRYYLHLLSLPDKLICFFTWRDNIRMIKKLFRTAIMFSNLLHRNASSSIFSYTVFCWYSRTYSKRRRRNN